MTGMIDRIAAAVDHAAFGKLGARELRVLLVLVLHARQDGLAWPSLLRSPNARRSTSGTPGARCAALRPTA